MNRYQTALSGQTAAYQASAAELAALQAEADRLYEKLSTQIEREREEKQLAVAQRAAQQAESAYHDLLLSANPLGLQNQRTKEQTQYQTHAAYNTYGADRAWVQETQQQASAAVDAALDEQQATLVQSKADTNAATTKAAEQILSAYAKERIALLKKAYKDRMDTTGV